jgi:hypothetical protein
MGFGNVPGYPCAAQRTDQPPLWHGKRDAHALDEAVLTPRQPLAGEACHPIARCVPHEVPAWIAAVRQCPTAWSHPASRPEAASATHESSPRPAVGTSFRNSYRWWSISCGAVTTRREGETVRIVAAFRHTPPEEQECRETV